MSASYATSMVDRKVVATGDLPNLRAEADGGRRRIVLCHGVFDVLHPGHISHLRQARALGDELLVSVTADRFVARGPGQPIFSEAARASAVEALGCVDHVVLTQSSTALPVIEAVRPDVYCKGLEYADHEADVTGNMRREADAVTAYGGEVRYLGDSADGAVLDDQLTSVPSPAQHFARAISSRLDGRGVREIADAMASLRVLVVGDVIIDEYVRCSVLGVTAKDHVPSVRWMGSERHWGGAYAVARHLASCCGGVTLMGIAGTDDDLLLEDPPPDAVPVELAFERDPAASTIVKRRYVVENKLRAELDKVFSVNYLSDEAAIAPDTRRRFARRLADLVATHDLAIVCDYGHGVLDEATIEVLERTAPHLALNCQTNSSNFGFNPITKYSRADSFCVDQTELRVAFRDRSSSEQELLTRLRDHLGADFGWLTLGSSGSLAVSPSGELERAPALTLHVRDTIGAGDAFFAIASLCARLGQPVDVGSFLANVAGALAVNVPGNKKPLDRLEFLKFAASMLRA